MFWNNSNQWVTNQFALTTIKHVLWIRTTTTSKLLLESWGIGRKSWSYKYLIWPIREQGSPAPWVRESVALCMHSNPLQQLPRQILSGVSFQIYWYGHEGTSNPCLVLRTDAPCVTDGEGHAEWKSKQPWPNRPSHAMSPRPCGSACWFGPPLTQNGGGGVGVGWKGVKPWQPKHAAKLLISICIRLLSRLGQH